MLDVNKFLTASTWRDNYIMSLYNMMPPTQSDYCWYVSAECLNIQLFVKVFVIPTVNIVVCTFLLYHAQEMVYAWFWTVYLNLWPLGH